MPKIHFTHRTLCVALLLGLVAASAKAGNREGQMTVSLTVLPGCTQVSAAAAANAALRCSPGLAYAVRRQQTLPDTAWQAAAREWLLPANDALATAAAAQRPVEPMEMVSIEY